MTKIMHILEKSVDGAEVGEMLKYANRRLLHVINNIVQMSYDKGIRGKYYIHFWFQSTSEGYAPKFLCRRIRPSPYQMEDHYLWSVEDGGKVNFEWCIPKKEIRTYILGHPYEFDSKFVEMLKKYMAGTLDQISDYVVKSKVI
jgi:hypothetical protein